MVAIRGMKSTATGALFNEIPDRLADPLFLVPLGYAAGYPWLGWLTALLAVLTAYVRVLGGALGQLQDFRGLLPKQRRMAVLTLALLIQAMEDALWGSRVALLAAAIIIAAGSLATCISARSPSPDAWKRRTCRARRREVDSAPRFALGCPAIGRRSCRLARLRTRAAAADLLCQSHQPFRHSGDRRGIACGFARRNPSGGLDYWGARGCAGLLPWSPSTPF
jgi:hypothetical protein